MTLYHGTSWARWQSIQKDGVLKIAPSGVEGVSMTPDMEVATYFAELAADADESETVILTLDRAALEEGGFEVEDFVDDVWDEEEGEGACEWEQEVICWSDIPASFILSAKS